MSFTPPVWSLTASQLMDHKSLTTMLGVTFSPQADQNNALYLWRADVDRAIALKLPIPDEVLLSRQRGAHPIASQQILNAKGRPFTWSFSALQDFEGCPLRYAHRRFFCDVTEPETEAQRWGNRVHKAGELHVLGQDHKDPEAFAVVQKYAELFRSAGAEAEIEVCLNENMKPVSWFAKDAWFRMKLDILLTQPHQTTYADYKTGKQKDDYDQLEVCCAMLSVVRPEIEVFNGKYIWLREQTTSGRIIPKSEIPQLMEKTLGRIARMKKAWESGNFPARPSGLCRWSTGQCPAYDKCQYRKG